MAKVTSKLQVTVPKALAKRYGIAPGAEIQWEAAGEVIRVVPAARSVPVDRKSRRRLFDKATQRQRERESSPPSPTSGDRGWTREELYDRRPSR
jgi:bifunctional DNA-binding transcriptional regulator/antitoxin component of YhaV-PrlF toxin-antitoxin module